MEPPRNESAQKQNDGSRDGTAAAIEMVNVQVAPKKDKPAFKKGLSGVVTTKCFALKLLGVRGVFVRVCFTTKVFDLFVYSAYVIE